MHSVHEDLRKWFKQKWVNIGKKDKSGKHPECGTSGDKRGYAKCVPASKARSMSKKDKESATRRKRRAQNKAGRGGKNQPGQGRKPIMVKTKKEIQEKLELFLEKNVPTNPSKWSYYKSQAKKKFDVYPSAYANAWAAKKYKAAGGGWKKEQIGEYDVVNQQDIKEFIEIMKTLKSEINEAEYQGRKVKLNKPMRGDVKKFKVYVKNPKGNVVKVNFGHGGTSAKKAGEKTMQIQKDIPSRRKAFRARHNCDQKKDKTTAGYWSCKFWEKGKTVTDLMKG